MTRRRFWFGLAFSTAFSAGALYLVVRDIDWQAALDAAARMRWEHVLLATLVIGAGLVARGFRWHYLLGNRLPLKRSLNLTFIAFLVNNLLPFRAGEIGRIEFAARGEFAVPRPTALSVAVVERLLDLLTLALLFGLSVTYLSNIPASLQNAVGAATALAIAGSLALVMFATLFQNQTFAVVDWLQTRVPPLKRWHARQQIENLLSGIIITPRYLLLALFWNAIAWLMLIAAYFLLMASLEPAPSLIQAVLLVVAVAFAITIPTTIASIGIIEHGTVLALTSQGYASDESLAIGLTVHLVTLGIYAICGLYGMWSETVSLPAIVRRLFPLSAQRDAAQM